ncbi:MFS transporter [Clostridium sp. AF18-27]|uniref:MFS transporter n=1 Tax=Enterocloster lavalensis TaxID=460384 RepID=UPI000D19E21B|nr:MFS transporter [Enterocloster lavalensis]MCB6344551.1 MFS transporter [Enterocloster lavalensis]PST33332.1 MFS transporter [Enterocloster lavalensis]RHR53772.1 MFS transporter [Clostridium sp. AF18-27]
MSIHENYNHTLRASYIGYISQAIVNNFAPLLFLTFQKTYGISLDKITLLVTMNFAVQLLVDFLAAGFVDRIGYRKAIVLAHLLCAGGVAGLGILPELTADPYLGFLGAVLLYAAGGGLIEVMISPIVEACPTERKEAAMSLLHSFYCWGHVLVVVASTVFFRVAGIGNWRILAFIWALVPFFNCFYFARVPIRSMTGEDRGMSMRQLAGSGVFWLFVLLMVCSGASEQAMSQWASAFAESALQVGKTMGDLLGPCLFALLMGTSRAVYARFSRHMPLIPFMVGSGFLCIAGYLLAVWSKAPVMALMGCGLCGLSVGILWPGTFSLSCARIPRGGTAMAALLALGGDVGCSLGPTVVGLVSNTAGGSIRAGLLAAVVFPVLLLLCLSRAGKRGRKAEVIGEVV